MRRARRQGTGALSGYVVTWDVDSRDHAACARVRRFIFGEAHRTARRVYRYPGFVERDGVRYLGQSVLFVSRDSLSPLRSFLLGAGVEHHVIPATLGRVSST